MIKQKSKTVLKSVLGFMALVLLFSGVYNAIVLNSHNFMQDKEIKFVKRLDEIDGVVKKGNFVKIANVQTLVPQAPKKVEATFNTNPNTTMVAEAPMVAGATQSAITKRLDLKMTEFYNQEKFKNPLSTADFDGSIFVNEGIIESLEVTLPKGESINISYSEISGNIFQYESEGNTYSGMIYEAGTDAYMVTITNGPYQGSRMKFQSANPEVEANREVAQEGNDAQEVIEQDRYANDVNFEMEVAEANREVAQEVQEFVTEEEKIEQSEMAQAQAEAKGKFGFDFEAQ
ncbi:MAG: hypothetical protein JNM93_03245 [Bacteriovoracaceae bacterium]|nr:hypothetical protein [Bacteriovoracaceae bacterium]